MPVVTGAFLVGLVSDSSAQPCPSPPALFNKEPASSQTRRKDTGMLGGLERVGFPTPRRQEPPGTGIPPPASVPHFCPSQCQPQCPHQPSLCQRTCPGRKHIPRRHSRESPPIRAFTRQPCAFISWELSTVSVPATPPQASRHSCGSLEDWSPLEGSQLLIKMLMENPTSPPLSLAAPPSSSLLSCLSLPAGPIQIIPTLSTLPQGLWQISGAGTGVSSILIYQGAYARPGSPPPLPVT